MSWNPELSHKPEYPDWLPEQTRVIKRKLPETKSWKQVRAEVQEKFGRIYEDVVSQSVAEYLGFAYFRVAKKGNEYKR